MSDYFREQLNEERATNATYRKKILDLRYLSGYYGHAAKRSGDAELAALVREMTEVLDGTWLQPEGPATDGGGAS